MKLNNYGWSAKEMILLCSILLIALFIATFFIIQMMKQFGLSFKESANGSTSDYEVIEQNIKKAANQYIEKYGVDNSKIVKTTELLQEHYLTSKDLTAKDNDFCTGYAQIDNEDRISVFIKCKGYTTQYYQNWKMGDA